MCLNGQKLKVALKINILAVKFNYVKSLKDFLNSEKISEPGHEDVVLIIQTFYYNETNNIPNE